MDKTAISLLCDIYTRHPDLLHGIDRVIDPDAAAIAEVFYQEMLAIPASSPFLDNTLVNERLHATMTDWLRHLFKLVDVNDVPDFVERQAEIGRVHARVNVPMRLVALGMRVLKREISRRLITSEMDRETLAEALVLAHDIMDQLGEIIAESYVNDIVVNERNAQSLQMDAMGHQVALECERQRSLLFDWLRRLLLQLYHGDIVQAAKTTPLKHSDFGLWLVHKAELLFPDNATVNKLMEQLEHIDLCLEQVLAEHRAGNNEGAIAQVRALNDLVTHTGWLMSTLAENTLAFDHGRDPLTRLLNRRYLPRVMRRENELAIKHNMPYSVLFIDLDHFKYINDEHGHESGDLVLSQMAEILASVTRAGDFVFRYGGEEFLAVLADTSEGQALRIAERIRRLTEEQTFSSDREHPLRVTVSIGVAAHDGHPDYTETISRADAALYRAKEGGRNRCELAASGVSPRASA